MSKITPQDYIDAEPALGRAGFMAIRNMLEEKVEDDKVAKTIVDVATTYGIDERVVELVKTTTSFSEFQTIVRLENERRELEQKLDSTKKQEEKVKPKRWHYIVAGVILLTIVVGIGWGLVALIRWLVGLF